MVPFGLDKTYSHKGHFQSALFSRLEEHFMCSSLWIHLRKWIPSPLPNPVAGVSQRNARKHLKTDPKQN